MSKNNSQLVWCDGELRRHSKAPAKWCAVLIDIVGQRICGAVYEEAADSFNAHASDNLHIGEFKTRDRAKAEAVDRYIKTFVQSKKKNRS